MILIAAALGAGASLAAPLVVSAHALPQSAVPAEGSSVEQAPRVVEITFGETPDPLLSSITVADSSGADVDAGRTAVAAGAPTRLEVPVKHLGDGVYTVTWKTVSSVDGHLATGSFAFGVGVPADRVHQPAPVAAAPPSGIAVLTRLLLFAGLVVAAGGVVLGFFAFGAPSPALARTVLAGATAAFAGALGVIATEAQAAGVGLSALLSSSLGRTLLARGIPAVALLGAALLLLRGRGRRLLGCVAGLAALAAMGADVLSSHAAAESPVTIDEAAQWLHIASAAVWIGGLVGLLVLLRGTTGDDAAPLARRLSTLAGAGLVVVAATGVLRAVVEVQTWGNLLSTAFGILVLLKVSLLLLLAGLGALNRFGNLPRLPGALRSLRRAASAEALVALGALTVAAALVNVAPPAEYAAAAAAPAQASPIVATGSDFATTVRVRLMISPGGAGFNLFAMRVADYDSGATVAAGRVELQFTQPIRPALGTSTLTLTRRPDGSFSARGGNLAIAGVWEVAAIIENGVRSAEVHLQVITNAPLPEITSSRFTGLPLTLYTVTLTRGRSVQVYLDPNAPGAGEFHTTFFNGFNELRVAQVTVGATPPGGTPTILVTRPLDAIGHYVSDAHTPAGSTRFDIIATLPGGEVLSTYIIIRPGS